MTKINLLPITPFPGSKRKYTAQILGDDDWDCILSPFLGGGAVELSSNAPIKIVAENDPILNLQWQAIIKNQWNEVCKMMRSWQDEIGELIFKDYWGSMGQKQREFSEGYLAYKALSPRKRREYAFINPDAHFFLREMDRVWDCLIKSATIEWDSDELRKDWVTLSLCSSWLSIRKLTFGGVLRTNKKGKLNVKWALDKLIPFVKFRSAQPLLGDAKWILCTDALEACNEMRKLNRKCLDPNNPDATGMTPKVLAIVDPPYTESKGTMTPAYLTHSPKDLEVAELSIEVLTMTMGKISADKICFFSYFSDDIDRVIESLAKFYHYSLERVELGELTTMFRATDGKDIQRPTENRDYMWVLTLDQEV